MKRNIDLVCSHSQLPSTRPTHGKIPPKFDGHMGGRGPGLESLSLVRQNLRQSWWTLEQWLSSWPASTPAYPRQRRKHQSAATTTVLRGRAREGGQSGEGSRSMNHDMRILGTNVTLTYHPPVPPCKLTQKPIKLARAIAIRLVTRYRC